MNKSRHEWRTKQYEGLCHGQHLCMRFPLRNSTHDNCQPDEILIWGDKQITLNVDSLPQSIAKLLPSIGWLTPNCNAKHWEAFVLAADGRQLFKTRSEQ